MKNKHLLSIIAFILLGAGTIFVCLNFFYHKNHPVAKNVMFVLTTKTLGGKGVLELYLEMKKLGHNVKISFVPLDAHKNGNIYNIDLDFVKKFEQSDVLFPCGTEDAYNKCDKLTSESINNFKPDYVFIQNPYDNIFNQSLKQLTKKMVFIVYGPHLFHQASINDKNLPNIIDLVFVDSESTKDIYIQGYSFSSNNVVVSGYQPYKNMRDYKKVSSQPLKETILWLPRWTLSFKNRDLFEGGSTFLNYHYFFYNYALNNPDINFIIRPHILLFSPQVVGKHLSKNDFDEIFQRFSSLPNVVISDHENKSLVDDIGISDVIISDGTSALGEVVVADKPIIYLSNGWNNEFNSNLLSQEFIKYLYLAYSPDDIIQHLDQIRKNNYLFVDGECADGFGCKFQNFKCRILEKTCNIKDFKRILDPVENPAKFIAEYLLYN
jgi:hypothetical protein